MKSSIANVWLLLLVAFICIFGTNGTSLILLQLNLEASNNINDMITIFINCTGCANKKNNPLGKIRYLSYCKKVFFTKITAFSKEDTGHICSKFRYSICYVLEIAIIWTEKYIFLNEQVLNEDSDIQIVANVPNGYAGGLSYVECNIGTLSETHAKLPTLCWTKSLCSQ